MIWPFKSKNTTKDVEELRKQVSEERSNLYNNLFKLDAATRSLDSDGVRGMLSDMFKQLDEARKK